MDRLRQELRLVERHFGRVSVDEGLKWFIIEEFPLPPGLYNRQQTRLLHFLGAGYPQTPPDNFLVPAGLRTASGEMPGSGYAEGHQHLGDSWGLFSWHAGNWNPAPEILDGDNLVAFLFTVQKRFAG